MSCSLGFSFLLGGFSLVSLLAVCAERMDDVGDVDVDETASFLVLIVARWLVSFLLLGSTMLATSNSSNSSPFSVLSLAALLFRFVDEEGAAVVGCGGLFGSALASAASCWLVSSSIPLRLLLLLVRLSLVLDDVDEEDVGFWAWLALVCFWLELAAALGFEDVLDEVDFWRLKSGLGMLRLEDDDEEDVDDIESFNEFDLACCLGLGKRDCK
jgi:hypothetical protein